MRALTVKQPWAWAIFYAGKEVENRTRPFPSTVGLPARILIHAGKAWDGPQHRELPDGSNVWREQLISIDNPGEPKEWYTTGYPHHDDGIMCGQRFRLQPFGAIVGVVTVLGFAQPDEARPNPFGSKWADAPESGGEIWHWHLTDPQAFTRPVPCRGALGLWTPDDETMAAVSTQIKETQR